MRMENGELRIENWGLRGELMEHALKIGIAKSAFDKQLAEAVESRRNGLQEVLLSLEIATEAVCA